MEMRVVPPEALTGVSLSLKKMVTKVGGGLHAVNLLSESWPVDRLGVGASNGAPGRGNVRRRGGGRYTQMAAG